MSDFSDLITDTLEPQLLATFGDEITYYPRVGTDYAITGVLDSGSAVQQGERAYQTFWAPLANFTGGEPVKGDHIVIGTTTYRVGDIDKEHLGGRLLKLQATNPIA
jgi:hypothetical protein